MNNEREGITTDPVDIKRMAKAFYKQFYAHKFDKLDEINQVLEKYNLPRHTEEKTI